MSHTYLVDLYEIIDDKLKNIRDELQENRSSGEQTDFLQGRIAGLVEFKQFLKAKYDIKLPRRLRGKG